MKGKTLPLIMWSSAWLQLLKRNDTVVMRITLPATQGSGRARKRLRRDGAALSLSPTQYSPDLNPIEMPFSKLKAYLRKAAERKNSWPASSESEYSARNLTAREAKNYWS